MGQVSSKEFQRALHQQANSLGIFLWSDDSSYHSSQAYVCDSSFSILILLFLDYISMWKTSYITVTHSS